MEKFNKDQYYLNIAKAVAERSSCFYWKCGAIVVDTHGDIISTGYRGAIHDEDSCANKGFCPYQQRNGQKPDGSTCECYGVHAAMRALIGPSRPQMDGGTIYIYIEDKTTGRPIYTSIDQTEANLILATGIKNIVYGSEY